MKQVLTFLLVTLVVNVHYAQDWYVFSTQNSGLTNDFINTVEFDQNGVAWVGAFDKITDQGNGGAFSYDGSVWQSFNSGNSSLTDNFVTTISTSAQANWYGTPEGIVRATSSTDDLFNDSNSSIIYEDVRGSAIDGNGNVWVATWHGLAMYNGSAWTSYVTSNSNIPNNNILDVEVDNNNTVWLATYGGLASFDGSTWTSYKTTTSNIPSNFVFDVELGNSGDVWVGTMSGLALLSSGVWTTYTTTNSNIPSDLIQTIEIESNNDVWIGTRYNGVAMFDGSTWTTFNESNSSLPSNWCNDITIDSDNNKWIATGNGLAVYQLGGVVGVPGGASTCPGFSASVTVTPSSCGTNDGMASVSVSGGTSPYAYSWSNNSTSASISNLAPGNYSVTVTDANGCSNTESAMVSSSGSPQLSATTSNASCGQANGSISVMATGGASPYSYQWDINAGLQTTQSATGLGAGSYTVSVTDNSGCTAVTTETIQNSGSAPTVSSNITNPSCGIGNGSVSLTVTGGNPPYSYQWDAAAGSQTTASVSGLIAGSYSVTITDNSGCETIEQVNLSNSNGPTTTSGSTNITCAGVDNGSAYVSVSGGQSPFTYSWSNGETTSSIANLSDGTYTVTVTDNSGCISTESIIISSPDPLITTISSTGTSSGLCTGNATALVNGGTSPYSYSWTDSNAQTTQTAINLCEGNYNVLVQDANGCSTLETVFIDVVTSIHGADLSKPDFRIFPNPSTSFFNLTVTHGIEQVEIYNLSGQKVFSENYSGEKTITLSLENRAVSGTYFVQIITNGRAITKKLIVQ